MVNNVAMATKLNALHYKLLIIIMFKTADQNMY